MNICLFSKTELETPLSVRDERGEHIIKVLHKKEGDTFFAGVINSTAGTAKITKIENGLIYYTFTAESDGKPLFPLKMIIGFPRPIQLKRLLRDIAALGVCEVHLTGTELGEKSYMQSNIIQDGGAKKALLDGTVQAASTHIPQMFFHKTISECITFIQEQKNDSTNFADFPIIQKLALDNVNPKCSLSYALNDFYKNLPTEDSKNHSKILTIAAIGSERGWTNSERLFLEQNGYTRCSMGTRIMRTETAATVSASIISNSRGWLN